MKEAEAGQNANPEQFKVTERAKDWKVLALLLLVTISLRAITVYRTEVVARDSIGFIRYALEFEQPGMTWVKVLKKNHQHPGYPLTVLAASYPVRYFFGGITPFSMELSAQLSSNLAAVLLVIPMFYLGKLLRDRWLGFWSALLFQFLPVVSHHLSDGISEAWFLLWCTGGIYFGCRAMLQRAPWYFALCGSMCGLAYLTRPEGALVLMAVGLVLAAWPLFHGGWLPWRQWILCVLTLTIPAFAIASIYFLATGHFTNKPSMDQILAAQVPGQPPPIPPGTIPITPTEESGPKPPQTFWNSLFAGIWELGIEIMATFHYLWVLPVALGMWWQRGLLRTNPCSWLMSVLCLFYAGVLVALAMKAGYVSNRHVLIMVMCGTYAGAWALLDWPTILPQAIFSRRAAVWSLAGLFLMVGTCLPKALQRLHGNRAGQLAAGLWLAQRVQPGDIIRDDHCWAHYFAGQVFLENQPVPKTNQKTSYTVISRARVAKNIPSRKQEEQKILASGGKVVFHWPSRQPLENARVVIYAKSSK